MTPLPWWGVEYVAGPDGVAVPALGGARLADGDVITVHLGGGEVVGTVGLRPGAQAMLGIQYSGPDGMARGAQVTIRLVPGALGRVGGRGPLHGEPSTAPAARDPEALRAALDAQDKGEAYVVMDGESVPLADYLLALDALEAFEEEENVLNPFEDEDEDEDEGGDDAAPTP